MTRLVRTPAENDDLERSVASYLKEKNEANLNSLVKAAGGLVHHFARVHSGGRPGEDVIQAGYEGLLKALRNYDSSRNVRFSTYASYWIMGEIRRELWKEATFYTSGWIVELQKKIRQATDDLRQSLGEEPSLQSIAEAVNVQEDGIVQAMLAGRIPLEEVDLSRIRSIRYESFQLPIEDKILLYHALEKLSELQKKVVYLVFYQEMTQSKTASLLGINQRRVSRLLKKALEKMALYIAN
ncbi:MAG TPA: sigma-70 family RNA polymerase sigma factor [Clostridia bacterium]|nr:sigma-70 family RNA polymerase sigma factor [Clostridia bacterium]